MRLTGVSRDPTRALNTYSEGKVTSSVSMNRAGTLTTAATSCMGSGCGRFMSAKRPMKAP